MGVNYSGVKLTLVSNGTTYNGTTDSSGNYVFSNLAYAASAQLSWKTDGGPYPAFKESSMNVAIDSTKTVNVALTPLYALQFEVGQANATVKVTGVVSQTVNTDATLKATIYSVPIGSVSYTVTKDGFTTISDIYTVTQTTSIIYTIYATLQRAPKLVIESGEFITNYQLDSSYVFASFLVVGPGCKGYRGGGGGGGMCFVKNIIVADYLVIPEMANSSDRSRVYFRVGSELNGVIAHQAVRYTSSNIGGTGGEAESIRTPPGTTILAGGTGGGSGSGSSGGPGDQGGGGGGTKLKGKDYNNNGGVGGDGGDGIISNPGGKSLIVATGGQTGSPYNSTVIPLTSIFNGTGKGGNAGYAGGGGGGGYGNGGNGGQFNASAGGYGAGGGGTQLGDEAGDYGTGVICIYYHNNLI